MSEGNDPRVIAGAIAAFNFGICQIVLLGSKIRIKTECKNLGLNLPREISIINPEKSELLSEFEKEYLNLRKKKGGSIKEAQTKIKK